MKFYRQDVNKLCKTILIGMPAAGKSTIGNYIAEGIRKDVGIEMQSVSTDRRIKELAKDIGNTFVQKFLQDNNIPGSDQHLLITASNFIAKYGEPLFRDFESAVIVDMLQKGEFEGKIPDLGGKAILHPQTAKAFKEQGYQCIYMNVDKKELTQHVLKDYIRWRQGVEITRSNINAPIKNAEIVEINKWMEQNLPHYNVKANKYNKDDGYKLNWNYCKTIDNARAAAALLKVTALLEQREKGYQAASTAVIDRCGNLDKDVKQIMNIVRETNTVANRQKAEARLK